MGNGIIEKILKKPNKTDIARVKSFDIHGEELVKVRGFITKDNFPGFIDMKPTIYKKEQEMYVCHCDDVTLGEIITTIGDRKFISVDEIKHTTRLGMGACRGKRCIRRLKQVLRNKGISIVGDATPRGPLSNQLSMGELFPGQLRENIIIHNRGKSTRKIEVESLVAVGGIGGGALFRYFAEAGKKPVLINFGRGASWRNIAGGRPAFSLPEIADIARHNHEIFKELQKLRDINLLKTRYINFAHDDATFKALDESRSWSDAYMVEPRAYAKEIAPGINPLLSKTYQAALVTRDCWQATPGRVIDLVRRIGIENGGKV